ncbi:hypothetical protein [Nostoc sp.]|uniref:hypothetical protein n=1 Tax=Nostoc sp. TaxID=1180 RepID=UPI002FF9B089
MRPQASGDRIIHTLIQQRQIFHKFNVFIRHLNGDMAGIPPQLLNRLRQALLECEQFESDRDLRAIFIYEPLRPWRSSVPQAHSRTSRVDNLIAFLGDKHRSDTKENALVLFVRLLSEQIDEADERHQQLADLALELERAIVSSTVTKNSQQNSASNTTSSDHKKSQPASPNFFAYDDAWVGRDNLINDLSSRVRGSWRNCHRS